MSPALSHRILILGARGRLGGAQVRRFGGSGRYEVLAPGRDEVDLARPETIAGLRRLEFNVLINCAAITSPDACEDDPETARRVNAEAPGALAALCREQRARMIHISTDYVFGGEGNAPLTEAAETRPVSVYGETKLAGERAVLAACPAALVARVSWLFGPDRPGFPEAVLREARAGQPLRAIADKWSTPTSTDDVAIWLEKIVRKHAELAGVLHLCNSGTATWQEFAQVTVDTAQELGLLPERLEVQGQELAGFPLFRARRPRFTPMSNALLTARTGIAPEPWQAALRRYLEEVRQREVLAAAN
ncbi:MAG TPA: dTDP-4-dehydrorhamnose reductase [Prosthecobacter sp.]|nr:dTDP-4-dehydrorhamnose reductase [Prosthecobacter sp.]